MLYALNAYAFEVKTVLDWTEFGYCITIIQDVTPTKCTVWIDGSPSLSITFVFLYQYDSRQTLLRASGRMSLRLCLFHLCLPICSTTFIKWNFSLLMGHLGAHYELP